MPDAVLFSQIFQGLDERSSVVRDDFLKCAPSAEDLLEDEGADGSAGLRT